MINLNGPFPIYSLTKFTILKIFSFILDVLVFACLYESVLFTCVDAHRGKGCQIP